MSFGWLSGFAFGGFLHCFLEGRWIDGSCLLIFSGFAIILPKMLIHQPAQRGEAIADPSKSSSPEVQNGN